MLNLSILLVLAVVGLALYLFVKEIFPVDVTALLIMAVLMLLKLVTPEEGISGFSNQAVVTILAMFMLSTGIEKTGLLHTLGIRVFGLVGSSEYLQLITVMLVAAPFSGFLNNSAIVAIMLPFIMNLSKMSKTSSSKLLIPLSYVSMSAGMLTLIGTSTNLLTNSILRRMSDTTGIQPFRMFDFWKIGIIVLAITMLYFLTAGYFILPRKKNNNIDDAFDNLKYTLELKINEGSSLIGKEIKSTILRRKYRVRILRLERDKDEWTTNFSNRVLHANDILTIEAQRDVLMNLESEKDVEIIIEELHKQRTPQETLQMIVPQGSRFIGKKVSELNLDKKYKAVVMAVRKGQKRIVERLDKVKLHLGDLILLKTTSEYAEKLKQDQDMMILGDLEISYRNNKKWIAIAIMFGVVLIAALGIYPILVTALVGVILMILTGVLTAEEAYESIRLDVIFLLAGMIPLGIALENSGAASFLASIVSGIATGLPVVIILIAMYAFTTIITEVLSNNAAVILLIPVGIDIANQLGFNPVLLVLTIMFAASTSFLTPLGYQTNTMVYGTGVYKFSDFFKVGIILNIVLALVTPLIIMKIWPV